MNKNNRSSRSPNINKHTLLKHYINKCRKQPLKAHQRKQLISQTICDFLSRNDKFINSGGRRFYFDIEKTQLMELENMEFGVYLNSPSGPKCTIDRTFSLSFTIERPKSIRARCNTFLPSG